MPATRPRFQCSRRMSRAAVFGRAGSTGPGFPSGGAKVASRRSAAGFQAVLAAVTGAVREPGPPTIAAGTGAGGGAGGVAAMAARRGPRPGSAARAAKTGSPATATGSGRPAAAAARWSRAASGSSSSTATPARAAWRTAMPGWAARSRSRRPAAPATSPASAAAKARRMSAATAGMAKRWRRRGRGGGGASASGPVGSGRSGAGGCRPGRRGGLRRHRGAGGEGQGEEKGQEADGGHLPGARRVVRGADLRPLHGPIIDRRAGD